MFNFFSKKKEPEQKPDEKVTIVRPEAKPAAPPKEKLNKNRYRCNSCGYRFERKIGIEFNNICPYCGKRAAVMDNVTDAQKLIEEVADIRDD